MDDVDTLIIGGGISGLSIAWWLAQEGLSCQIWEADSRPGGKIRSQQKDGYLTEQAASMLMNFRPEVAELIDSAGLTDQKTRRAKEAESNRFLVNNGQLTALPMKAGAMLLSPMWSLGTKLRLLAEPFVPPNGNHDETVSQFITRRLGREVLEKAMEPFVAGTLAGDPDLASATATLPRLTALEHRYGSITAGIIANKLRRRKTACVTETFSFKGGMNTLIDTLAKTTGVDLQTNYKVDEITRTRDGWRVTATTPRGQRSVQTCRIVLAAPAPAVAKLMTPLDPELGTLLNEISYAPVIAIHTGFNRADVGHLLNGTGFLVPRKEGHPVTGNLWMSTLFPNRAPDGKVLLTTYLGGSRRPEVIDWTDEQLTDEALRVLQPLIDLKGELDMVRIDRHRQALPLYHGACMAREQAIAAHLQRLPGIHIEANYRGGVSVRDRIARGRIVARDIIRARQRDQRGKLLTPAYDTPALVTNC